VSTVNLLNRFIFAVLNHTAANSTIAALFLVARMNATLFLFHYRGSNLPYRTNLYKPFIFSMKPKQFE